MHFDHCKNGLEKKSEEKNQQSRLKKQITDFEFTLYALSLDKAKNKKQS